MCDLHITKDIANRVFWVCCFNVYVRFDVALQQTFPLVFSHHRIFLSHSISGERERWMDNTVGISDRPILMTVSVSADILPGLSASVSAMLLTPILV
jgi:hypothetical protein